MSVHASENKVCKSTTLTYWGDVTHKSILMNLDLVGNPDNAIICATLAWISSGKFVWRGVENDHLLYLSSTAHNTI
jgi:hypothetical protein